MLSKPPKRPDRFPHQHLRVSQHEEVADLADRLVSEALIEGARTGIEGGDAEEHVGRVPEDALFGERNQPRPEAAAASRGIDADRLDVSAERTLHVDDDE